MTMKMDLTGKRFGKLTAISENGRTKDGAVKWLCQCDCGNKSIVRATVLKRGITVSCGCIKSDILRKKVTTHGLSKTAEYETWCGMRKRCLNKNTATYSYYGGRGITICERWNIFENFLSDMGTKPHGNYSIERIDVNGNYEPGNCKWASPTEQARNTRKRKDGKNVTVGVSWHKATHKYMAYIVVNGKPVYLGVFVSIDEAAKARKSAELKYWGKEPKEELCAK